MFKHDLQAVCLNISGYRFTPIDDATRTLDSIEHFSRELDIKGSVFLATEGINISLAGNILAIKRFQSNLKQDPRFANIRFHQTYSKRPPFNKLLFKIKDELVPLGENPLQNGPFVHQYLAAKQLQRWLDEGKEITLLDMRNEFEVALGTFSGAQQLQLNGFRQLPDKIKAINKLPKDIPLVTFCTGGIRCEKAGPYLEQLGFNKVYQLDGGIIEYLRTTNGSHWQGNCFVFDERITLSKDLRAEQRTLCLVCQKELANPVDKYCNTCVEQGASINATI